MPPANLSSDVPAVLLAAGDTESATSPESIYLELEDKQPEAQADYLSVTRWECPTCSVDISSVEAGRTHYDETTDETADQSHAPIHGYSDEGDLIAVIPKASSRSNEQLQPVHTVNSSPTPLPETSAAIDGGDTSPRLPTNHEIASAVSQTTPSLSRVQTEAITHRTSVHDLSDNPLLTLSDIAGIRWLCTCCGTFTAASPAVLSSHVFRSTDSDHNVNEGAVVGLLLTPDGDTYAGIQNYEDGHYVTPASAINTLPNVSLPVHWKLVDEYPSVDPSSLSIDYWICPFCWTTTESSESIRTHIQATQTGPHKGQSGHYPDHPIFAYNNGEPVAMLTPAVKDDPNDQSYCLWLRSPDILTNVTAAVAALLAAREPYQQALSVLDISFPITDDLLANAIGISPAEFETHKEDIEDIPPEITEEVLDDSVRNVAEVRLANELAEQVEDPSVTVGALIQTPSVETTHGSVTPARHQSRDTTPDEPAADHIDRTVDESGTTIYTIDASAHDSDDTAAVDQIPPEPELAVADLSALDGLHDVLKTLAEQELDDTTETRSTTNQQADAAEDILSLLENLPTATNGNQDPEPDESTKQA